MLSKLIKHELRASRRIMLPFLGAVLALSVLAGISTTAMEHQVDYSWLNVVYGLIIFAFVMGVMAVCVVAVVVMIQRFYKNLLGDEGYVSFTLPATVDEHIFAKLISSFIWFFATAVVVVLSTFIMTATSLSAAFTEEGVVSINGMLNEVHFWEMFTGWDIAGYVLEGIVLLFVYSGSVCLHFYAAMAIGHSFNDHKGLLSVVSFFVLSAAMTMLAVVSASITGNSGLFDLVGNIDTLDISAVTHVVMLIFIAVELVKAALYYLPTTLCLKKWLNLA